MENGRRNFIKKSVLLSSITASALIGSKAQAAQDFKSAVHYRDLGKTGKKVSAICMGGDQSAHSPRFLEMAYRMGIRAFDTASGYANGKSELHFGEWFARFPERRKDIFLSTKYSLGKNKIEEFFTEENLDVRLKRLGTNYVDAFMMHSFTINDERRKFLNSADFKKQSKALKATGKVGMLGYSCHEPTAENLNAAAESGAIDIVMFFYNPFEPLDSDIGKAITRCHEAGIALMAMKTMRVISKSASSRLPELDKMGLTLHEGVLAACMNDNRISTICNDLENDQHIRSSTRVASEFKPLNSAQFDTLKNCIAGVDKCMCSGCPSCLAIAKSTGVNLPDIGRFVAYYEQSAKLESKKLYEYFMKVNAPRLANIDLEEAHKNCACHVNYPEIFAKAQRYFEA